MPFFSIMKSTTLAKLFYGTVIQPIRLNQLTVARHTVIGVNYEGKIVLVKQNVPIHQFKRITSEYNIEQIIHLHDHQFLLPGFIDTHIVS
jgi:cytosine/adenosine deaminase-related metal-dependent hydrolase